MSDGLGKENKINVPLKRIVKTAVDKLATQVIEKLKQADLGDEYKDKYVSEAFYKVVCGAVRHCAIDLSREVVVSEKRKLTQERDNLQDGLSSLLLELEKKKSLVEGKTRHLIIGQQDKSVFWFTTCQSQSIVGCWL